MIDLIGRAAMQARVRPVFSIPVGKQPKLLSEGLAAKWYEDDACAFILERQDEPLDDGDTAVLANCTEAWCDASAITPGLEQIAPELLALVADDVFKRGSGVIDDAFEEALSR
jgi:hypothetical protein